MVFCLVAKIIVFNVPGMSIVYTEGKMVPIVVASPLIRRRSPGTLALLMVSTVRFRSFRYLLSPKTAQARLTTAIIATAIVAGLAIVPAYTALVMAYSFVLTAPLGVLTAPLRVKLFGPETVAPPRTRLRSVFLPLVEEEHEGPVAH